MKIQLASDLHLENLPTHLSGEHVLLHAWDADLLILAGDIANGRQAIEMFKDWPVPVLYVLGNHEFYGHIFEHRRIELREAVKGTAIRILDNDIVELIGVRFLGCTLWTDYRLGDEWSQSELMVRAEQSINDHRQIRTVNGPFTAARALYEHEKSREWLQRELGRKFDGKTVVVTHHAPHEDSIHPRYEGNPKSAAFASSLDDLLMRADFWLHGHLHDSVDYTRWGCRVVANPLGYGRTKSEAISVDDVKFENQAFDRTRVIDLSDSERTTFV